MTRTSFAHHFDAAQTIESPGGGHSIFQQKDIEPLKAYVASGHHVKITSTSAHGTEEHHVIKSFDDRGNAVLYPSEEGTHPSGHVDPEAMVGKVSWPARAKGAARKLTQQEDE